MKQTTTPARAQATHAALLHASSFLRARLCDALPLKRSPELSFRLDPIAPDALALLPEVS